MADFVQSIIKYWAPKRINPIFILSGDSRLYKLLLFFSRVTEKRENYFVVEGIACVPAVLTFVSRVYQDQHWTSHDFLGAAIGYFVVTWVVDHHEQGGNRVQISSVYPLTIRITLN